VLAFYMNKEGSEKDRWELLSPKEQDLKKRWEVAFMTLLEWGSPEDTVAKLVNVFGISKATAYRDVNRAEMLLGGFRKFNKEAWKYISIERKHKLYQLALKKQNFELAFKIDKEIDKILGLGADESPFDPDKIKAQDYSIMISKKQERLIQHIMSQGGPVNMNVGDIEEISFEEIQNDEHEGD